MHRNRWELVKANPTYLPGALSEAEAQAIRWHSPSSARSSQVFCISAFGSLRHLPDGQEILQALLTRHFPDVGLAGPWKLTLEHTDRQVLDESGRVTPTSVDVFCRSASSVGDSAKVKIGRVESSNARIARSSPGRAA